MQTSTIQGTKMHEDRILNFSAGPAILPESVLEQLREDIWNLNGSGVGVLEHSHRGKEIDTIFEEAVANCKTLAGIEDSHEVLFLQGGASGQFAMIPMNFLHQGRTADYLVTGTWAKKAIQEAQRIGDAHCAHDGSATLFDHVPTVDEIDLSLDPAYLHYCSNNTIYGTRFDAMPLASCTKIVDMSSEMFSRPWDYTGHGLVYAGAQKNLGPAGVVLALVSKELMETARDDMPTILSYETHAKGGSRYHTPPVFPIHAMGLVFKWILAEGGLEEMERRNNAKAGLIYDVLDDCGGFYIPHSRPECRSVMNISFKTQTPELDKKFIEDAAAHGMSALKGHRSIGGMRASIYNAFPAEGCKVLADFMKEFARTNG
ncbi:MAG: 3-phosphoserine/phosphohydroxythreonine transaminase [Phycisphaerales bacterium]|nr:3-phosphoserine/phosphohydroxythreonine transaminase [Phycisphaerales bacterium]